MKKLIIAILIASLAIPALVSPVAAETASMDDALTVANNWITLIIEKEGDWGGLETAEVDEIQEFKRGEHVIGYFCHVKPKGYIVVSLHKELAPVKAYSATCDLDPESEEGMADLLKGKMERILDWTEQRVGPIELASPEDMDNALEINYRGAWAELEGDEVIFKEDLGSGEIEMNYQEGDWLLSSAWHQGDPFNRQCPAPPPGDDCTEAHCLVGCVATAGAQIMRYWNWPPYGVGSPYNDYYDWPDMPDTLTGSSPANQINSVGELCHEIGIAVGMDYCGGDGCASGIPTAYMEGVYENYYRYSTDCTKVDRSAFDDPLWWFNRMCDQFNANRPVQYRIYGHSIVGDGWQTFGSPVIYQYHMNYGWANTNYNTWYTLDALHCSWEGCAVNEEYMLENIYPAQALGGVLSGTYPREAFPYRYFDQDAYSNSATFQAGQYLQFLPGIKVMCISVTGDSIRFQGTSSLNTCLFTRGDTSRGICIYNGAIKVYGNSSIKLE